MQVPSCRLAFAGSRCLLSSRIDEANITTGPVFSSLQVRLCDGSSYGILTVFQRYSKRYSRRYSNGTLVFLKENAFAEEKKTWAGTTRFFFIPEIRKVLKKK